MKLLLVFSLMLLAAVSQAQDTTPLTPPLPEVPTTVQGSAGGSVGSGEAPQPLGPGLHRGTTASLPLANVALSAVPEFRGAEPGQPRRVFHLVLSQWLT
ncbi:MAG: hypothetical protein M3Y56_17010, partial [Armatimonadota bacterium]|nr:hypothetical protein [Armatimonadota bacterium]